MVTATADTVSFSLDDRRWMRRALSLAEQSLFISNPNPRVGCVLVQDGHWLAEGHTAPRGGPHAEISALQQAADNGIDPRGATAYVTLEPCSHQGLTPPCSQALIEAGIARVVYGLQDPNPLVNGQGTADLRQAGIQVDGGLFAEQVMAMNPGFCARMLRGTPWIRLKSAMSLDGHMALPDGQSQWLTGDVARADGHAWRARACLVLTGIGTIQSDNPILSVRAVETSRQPVRAVLDSHFRIDEQAHLFNGDPVWVFTTRADAAKAARLSLRNVKVIVLPSDSGGDVDLPALLQWLAGHEINEVHVEAGSRLLGAFVASGLADEWIAYIAPMILGAGMGLVSLPSAILDLAQARRYEFLDATTLGQDVRLHLRDAAGWHELQQRCGVVPASPDPHF